MNPYLKMNPYRNCHVCRKTGHYRWDLCKANPYDLSECMTICGTIEEKSDPNKVSPSDFFTPEERGFIEREKNDFYSNEYNPNYTEASLKSIEEAEEFHRTSNTKTRANRKARYRREARREAHRKTRA